MKQSRRYDPSEYRPLTFHDAVPAFHAGADSPRAYLERCLATIDEREGETQAFVTLNVEGARAAADASAERYRTGQALSPIDGMPIGIKDLYETADMPTQMGSPIFKGWHSKRDAVFVNALRRSGAVVLGKTVTTEFGFYNPGPTRNPFDPSRTPGGSSSGSAAAVGARMVPATIGSQVVGSLIRPAGYCANVGFKPSVGALNRSGGGTGLSQACIGLHAGSLEDAWSVSYQIAYFAGGDPGYPGLEGALAPAPPEKPRRLIKLETAGWPLADEATRARLDEALAALARQGIEIVTKADDRRIADFSEAILEAKDITHDICGYELRPALRMHRDRGPGLLSEDISRRLEVWERLTADQYRAALARRDALRRQHDALREIAPAFVTLSAAGAAPVGTATGDPVFAVPGSILGAPAISLPVLEIEEMPLGMQVLGYRNRDAELFGIARWLHQSLLPRA